MPARGTQIHSVQHDLEPAGGLSTNAALGTVSGTWMASRPAKAGVKMHAAGGAGGPLFGDVDLAGRIPARHPPRRFRQAVNVAPTSLDTGPDRSCAARGSREPCDNGPPTDPRNHSEEHHNGPPTISAGG
jgi:hypothetical protein